MVHTVLTTSLKGLHNLLRQHGISAGIRLRHTGHKDLWLWSTHTQHSPWGTGKSPFHRIAALQLEMFSYMLPLFFGSKAPVLSPPPQKKKFFRELRNWLQYGTHVFSVACTIFQKLVTFCTVREHFRTGYSSPSSSTSIYGEKKDQVCPKKINRLTGNYNFRIYTTLKATNSGEVSSKKCQLTSYQYPWWLLWTVCGLKQIFATHR